MSIRRFAVAWAGSFLVMFLLARVFNSFIIVDFVNANMPLDLMRAEPQLYYMMSGYGLLAFLMSSIYPRVVDTSAYSPKTGFVFGMAAGICWLLPLSVVLHSMYFLPITALAIDSAWASWSRAWAGSL